MRKDILESEKVLQSTRVILTFLLSLNLCWKTCGCSERPFGKRHILVGTQQCMVLVATESNRMWQISYVFCRLQIRQQEGFSTKPLSTRSENAPFSVHVLNSSWFNRLPFTVMSNGSYVTTCAALCLFLFLRHPFDVSWHYLFWIFGWIFCLHYWNEYPVTFKLSMKACAARRFVTISCRSLTRSLIATSRSFCAFVLWNFSFHFSISCPAVRFSILNFLNFLYFHVHFFHSVFQHSQIFQNSLLHCIEQFLMMFFSKTNFGSRLLKFSFTMFFFNMF